MFIPLRAHVPTGRRPWANYAIILVTVTCSIWGFVDCHFLWAMSGFFPVPSGLPEVLRLALGRATEMEQILPMPVFVLSSTLVHGGWLHLAGNMLFLWVFGNAVNYKFGQAGYLVLYVLSAFISGVAFELFQGGPAIGASGAIYGVVGAFLVFFPRNDITAIWFHMLLVFRTFEISSVWVILFWVGWDVLHLIWGSQGGVAYVSHVGGFAAGFGVALASAAIGWIRPTEDEQTLLEVLGLRKASDGP